MSDTTLKSYIATTDLRGYIASLTGPEWLTALRRDAAEAFARSEWPTTSDEEWRRTSLRAFEFDGYRIDAGATGDAVEDDGTAVAGRVEFHDEHRVASRLRPDLAEQGVVFSSLGAITAGAGAADADGPSGSTDLSVVEAAVRDRLHAALRASDNRIGYWHLALLADAVVLYVPPGVEITEPFVAEFVVSGDDVARVIHVIVLLGAGARAAVVKRVRSSGDGEALVLDGDDLSVGAAAHLDYTSIERLNDESIVFSNGRGAVDRDAQISRTEAILGGDFVKGRFIAELDGTGADAVLNGLYLARDAEHVDLRTVQGHAAPHTTSRAFYRGAVRDESHAIYQGLITVADAARGTDAYLTNKNLILSEDARADSIPSLTINTDDVRCSHGSTTGKLDGAQIFYLRSRGYTEAEARLTLIEGYYEDLIAKVPSFVQDELRELIADRLLTDDE